MSIYDTIKTLCDRKGIAVTALEKELGFGRGAIGKMKQSKPSAQRLQTLADYFGVSVDYLLGVQSSGQDGYYTDPETAKMAQEIFDNSELRVLFDVQRDMNREDLMAIYAMALALKRKERHE